MAGVKISNLPAITTCAYTDLIPEVQPASGGTTYKATMTQVGTLFGFDSVSTLLSLAKGGTNANLTATNNALVYSNASAFTLLSPTNSAVLASSAAGLPTWLGPMTNGQLIVGSTGNIPNRTTLTAGANVTVTNGVGTITIASSGNMTWSAITTATHTIVVSNAYIANRGAGVAFALPAASAVGDVFTIVGLLGIWSITQGAGQQISVGAVSTTVGAAGTLTAAAASDSAQFVCTVANLNWQVVGGPQTAGFVLA